MFLKKRIFTNRIMHSVEKMKWSWDKDEIYFEHNSCFLDANWLEKFGQDTGEIELEEGTQ